MSTTVDQAFVRQYERDVHEAFQRQGSKLMNTVRTAMGVVGMSTTFQTVGTGTATTKARHGAITPMNQDHTPVQCFLEDFYAGDWNDKLDNLKTNINERMVIANGGAYALGRKIDEQITTALDGTSQVAVTFTYTKAATIRNSMLAVVKALNANDVPDDGDRWAILPPNAWAACHTVPEFASADFIGRDNLPFMNTGMEVRSWLGVNWMMHTGSPGSGTASAKGFAWHKSAAGFASGIGITADITWHGDRAAWFVNHMMSGGACLIEDNGVIEITVNDTTALPTA